MRVAPLANMQGRAESSSCENYVQVEKDELYMMKIFTAVAVVMTLVACNDIESRVECVAICDKYSECYDSDYDVDGCAEECTDKYDADEDFIEDIDACDNCVDDKSCAESTFACAADCAGIVP